jgi:hypothetical protein
MLYRILHESGAGWRRTALGEGGALGDPDLASAQPTVLRAARVDTPDPM